MTKMVNKQFTVGFKPLTNTRHEQFVVTNVFKHFDRHHSVNRRPYFKVIDVTGNDVNISQTTLISL